MRTLLRIVPTQKTQREAVAWFVFGNDPAEWLAAATGWDVSLESVSFRPIPRSLSDRTPIGTLIIPTNPAAIQGKQSASGPLTIPFGRVADRLFLPTDAEVWPQVSESELRALLTNDSDWIFHPAMGLVRCERGELMRAVDLMQRRQVDRPDWTAAVEGTAFSSRLLSIEPTMRETADEILRHAGEGIGTEGGSLDELPPKPGEGLAGQLYQWTRPLRNAWKSLVQRSKPKPQPPGSPAEAQANSGNPALPGGGLLAWFGLALAPLAAAGAILGKAIPKSMVDQTARVREVDRLLHLLKNDPDAGLRFALPMGGGAAGRGVASPSNQLHARNIDFGLGKLTSGHPVDPWSIPPGQQWQLIQMYSELAAREIRMGRHRRAAYIFASLLGDLPAAANALEAGLHFREAAALYRDRLKRPVDAARCLEGGGLLDEAAELYLELGMIEKAADLYMRLDRPETAEQLLRKWAGQLTGQGQYVKASAILETKLGDIDGALTLLDEGWTASSQESETCLTNWFALLGKHGRHQEATQRIAENVTKVVSSARGAEMARVLSSVATTYVTRSVRRDAADATRIVVSRLLPSASVQDSRTLLSTIQHLAPQDRLLTRDCKRFGQAKERAARSVVATPKVRRIGITPVRSFELESADVEWRAAKSSGDAMYVVGHTRGGLLLRRISWLTTWIQNHQDIFWVNVSPDRQILLEVPRGHSHQILVHAVGGQPLGVRTFLGGSNVSGVEHAGSPSWATSSMVAFAGSDGGAFTWRVRSVFGTLELSGFGPNADQVMSGVLRLSVSEEVLVGINVSICATAKPVRIGVGQVICRPLFASRRLSSSADDVVSNAGQYVELGDIIQSLHNFRDRTTDCVVALFEEGGVMIAEPIQNSAPLPIAKGILSPRGTFLADGAFIVAGDSECSAYRFDEGVVREVGTISLKFPAVAVTQTDLPSQFAILHANGKVQVYTLDQ